MEGEHEGARIPIEELQVRVCASGLSFWVSDEFYNHIWAFAAPEANPPLAEGETMPEVTVRHRRNLKERNIEGLRKQLAQQEAKLHRNEVKQGELAAAWAKDKAMFDRIQLALLKLEEEEPLPGMESPTCLGCEYKGRCENDPQKANYCPLNECPLQNLTSVAGRNIRVVPPTNLVSSDDERIVYVVAGPLQDIPQDAPPAQRTGTVAPIAESVGAEAAQRATLGSCKHGKVQGWCNKAECQEVPHG